MYVLAIQQVGKQSTKFQGNFLHTAKAITTDRIPVYYT